MIHAAVMITTIEPHLNAGELGPGLQLPDLLEADDLRPESMRFFHIAHIEHKMVDA